MAAFKKREILEKLAEVKDVNLVADYIIHKINVNTTDIDLVWIGKLKSAISTLKSKRNAKFEAANRMKDRFELQNANWLNSSFIIPTLITTSNPTLINTSNPLPGRPSLPFEKKSDRSKRRAVAAINSNQKHDPQSLLMACRQAACRSGNRDLYTVVSQILKTPEQPKKIRKLLETPITKKTPEEGLAFLLNNSLTKYVYTNMRLETKKSGADIWPPYNKVREVKSQCRPPKEDIFITEKKAEVSLQSLLNHTINRIVQLQKDVIIHNMMVTGVKETEAVLMCSWGFDGSSGHSAYKQSYKSVTDNTNPKDQNLFVTTLIPLRLLTSENTILWNNQAPQSTRFCRPLAIEYVHESKEVILGQKRNVEDQIDKLQSIQIALDNYRSISVHCSLFLTLIDGKVLNIITGTKSMQSCPVCHATPKLFNDLSNKQKGVFLPNPKSLVHGISSLHAWIRILECCLHISYRLNVKDWQMRSVEHKLLFTQRKKKVQAILWEKLGFIVDKPKPGGSGITNDGNTARRAFEKPDLLVKCLGLDCQLLCQFKTILIALSIQFPINPIKFEQLCNSTAENYVKHYSWYPMPSTLHKILIHGADIISTSMLPVGILAEEASEARNKDYKNFRQFHSRKHDRKSNLADVFYRTMDTSDVIISSMSLQMRLRQKKLLSLPKEVKDLLVMPEVDRNEDKERTTSNPDDDCHTDEEEDITDLPNNCWLLNDIELSDEDN